MNKIVDYVDNVFMKYVDKKDNIDVKEELVSNLTERMNDYIAQGKNEDEAFNLTIASIGNMDELLNSLELNSNIANIDVITEVVEKYNKFRNLRAFILAFGILLISVNYFLNYPIVRFEDVSPVGLILMFVGIGFVIVAGYMISNANKYLREEKVKLVINNSQSRLFLDKLKSEHPRSPLFVGLLVFGIVLCSVPGFIIDFKSEYFILVASIGVFCIVFASNAGFKVPDVLYGENKSKK